MTGCSLDSSFRSYSPFGSCGDNVSKTGNISLKLISVLLKVHLMFFDLGLKDMEMIHRF